MNVNAWLTVIALSLAVGSISFTVGRMEIFAPFRAAIGFRSEWLGKLFSCPYCLSHWLAFAAVAWYQPIIVIGRVHVFDLALSVFIVVCLSMLPIWVAYNAILGKPNHEPKRKDAVKHE